jgi:hypothetical protein
VRTFTKATFGEIAPYLADYGYHPVPIKPGYKAPLLDDWQAGHPPDHFLPFRNLKDGRTTDCRRWGTGILTASCPAVDLDIKDRELVRVLIALSDERLGPSPFRMGAPPKVLLPFSTSAPFNKMSSQWWALPGEDFRAPGYNPHRIEVLGSGQQFVAYARHPRGTHYRWRRGCPMGTLLIDLPEIDAASAAGFLALAEQIMESVGGIPLRREEERWILDIRQPERPSRRHPASGGPYSERSWPLLDPETLAKRIDARHARRLKDGAWITACPAHSSQGQRSLSITPRDGGGSVVHCFGDCDFREVARAISTIVSRAP